jgi:prolipoprotein diacylglyceryltransferase
MPFPLETLIATPLIAGILAGVTLLATLPKQATVILLGAFVTGYGVYRLVAKTSTKSLSRWWGIPTGLFGGLVSVLLVVSGLSLLWKAL